MKITKENLLAIGFKHEDDYDVPGGILRYPGHQITYYFRSVNVGPLQMNSGLKTIAQVKQIIKLGIFKCG